MTRRHGASARQRRDALVQAAIEVAAEKGMAGVTHRAVTERAGLPLATVGYFFASITELAQEALRSKIAEDVATLRELADRRGDGQATAGEMLAAFAAAARPPRTQGMAFVEALLHSARTPELRAAVVEALSAGRAAVAAAGAVVGAPAGQADVVLALVHGCLVHELAAPEDTAPDLLLRGLRTLLVGSLVEAGDLDGAARLAGDLRGRPDA